MLTLRRAGSSVLLAILACGAHPHVRASAQSAAATPAFEVASVKANASGAPQQTIDIQPSGRMTLGNVPLRRIIQIAYGVNAWQVEGGPDWIGAARFDIVAKSEAPVPGADLWLMLRALLAERFRLAVRTETRDAPIFALVVARPDRGPGRNLRPATTDCLELMKTAAPDDRNPCGHEAGFGRMVIRGMTMDSLAGMLTAQQTDRSVVNRTGLTGNFDWDLTWTPQAFLDLARDGRRQLGDAPMVNGKPVDLNGPSLATALEEQLGLKLEGMRGPVDVLVIERVERPTED